MFRFAHPEYLNALYLIPVIIAAFWYLNRNRKKLLERFANKKLHKVLLPNFSNLKNILKFGIIILSLTFLIVAASNPQVGTRIQEVKQEGIDVYILLDVSRSMTAQDIKPSRLDKAKHQIGELIGRLRGDRIGLIIFAGQAYVQFPLTTDYSAANLFLSAVDVNSVPQQGTAIASAINLATKSFDYKFSTQKTMIIITDGEDHEGNVMEAVKAATDKGIKIYTIGLGSPDGVPIPIYNQQGQQTGFLQDQNGNTVLTKLDSKTLQEIASAGNGAYYQGTNYDDNLNKIYDKLSSLQKTEYGVKKVTDYEDRFYYLLAPAVFLLILEFFIPDKKSPWLANIMKRLGIEGS